MVPPSRYYTEPPHPVRKTITFTGGAGLGAVGTVALFTVTGQVLVKSISGFCSVLLAEGGATAEMSLGVVGDVDLFIVITEPEDIDANDFWVDDTPTEVGGLLLPTALKDILVTANIQLDITNDSVDSGVMEFACYYWPLSANGNIVAA